MRQKKSLENPQNALILAAESGMRGVQVPPRVLIEALRNKDFANISEIENALASLIASAISMSAPSKIHHIPPKLIIPAKESKDQRWLIKFRKWEEATQTFILHRDYTINEVPVSQREAVAKKRIKDIQASLIVFVGRESTKQSKNTLPKHTIISAISFFLERKKRIKHFKDYNQKLEKFSKWILSNDYHKVPLGDFSYTTIEKFRDEELKEMSNRTVRNYLNTISSVFQIHNKYNDPQVRNPTHLVEKDPIPVGKNLAFTPKQQKQQLTFIKNSNFPHYELAVKTMFYTLARTDELFKLQRWMIGAKHPDQIHMPDYICKNASEKNITITGDLHELFVRYGIYNLQGDYYVFAKNFLPGKVPYKSKYAGNRFRENVLEPLSFSKDYTFYSWKHTGVCMWYKAGNSIADIQQQAGWTDPQTFKVYLKSLGLFNNNGLKEKSPKLPG
jgi:integrase